MKKGKGKSANYAFANSNTSHYILMHFQSNFMNIAFIKTKTVFLGTPAKCPLKYVRLYFVMICCFFFRLMGDCFLLASNDALLMYPISEA